MKGFSVEYIKNSRALKIGVWIILFSIIFLAAGIICNTTVENYNGGKMPVHITSQNIPDEDGLHSLFYSYSDVNLPFLADIYYFQMPKYYLWFSIGDFFLVTGGIYVLLGASFILTFAIKHDIYAWRSRHETTAFNH
jgi:hypothetical protein